MFHWKIIFYLIILKILSFVFMHYYYTNSYKNNNVDIEQEEQKVCLTPLVRDFMMCWIKFTMDMINYSRSILKKKPEQSQYYADLENTKNELIDLFEKIHKQHSNKFANLINNQILIKIDLCNAVLNKNNTEINKYSEELTDNTNKLSSLFSELKKNKEDDLKLKEIMNSHSDKYMKSLHFINKAGGEELSRELVLGSIETVRLLFV